MHATGFVFAFFIIFFGASILATLALYTRQSLLVAYLFLGMLVGPWGVRWIPDTTVIGEISSVGIMFLLFLLGLSMRFKSLLDMLKGATIITIASSLIFAITGVIIFKLYHFPWMDSIIVGVAVMFSSTIIGLKLLPTTALHHQRIGDLMVSILLMQDVIAILVLLLLGVAAATETHSAISQSIKTILALPTLLVMAYLTEKYVLYKLFRKFNRIQEYLFLLSIGWCLLLAQLAETLGLSYEIGAFIAGVSLAASPISQFIAESLKPLRDFFLIIFFFSVGAGFNFHLLPNVWLPVLILLAVIIILKPTTYVLLLKSVDESKRRAWEVGVRLGQASEFSLLVAILAYSIGLIQQNTYIAIQAVTIMSFIISSYIVVLFYPSPMALNNKLRRD